MLLIASLGCLLFLTNCMVSDVSLVGKAAPDFQLTNYNDRPVQLNDYKNKSLVLVFYCCDTWKPCLKYLGEVQNNLPEINNLNAEVIALSFKDDKFRILATKARLGLTFPIIAREETAKVEKNYELQTKGQNVCFATVIIINGKVAYVYNSVDENDRMPVGKILQVLQKSNNT